ncbi:MAG: hypothetical protein A2381_07640 [Bdellovibrionales bacterium RIFOXYB1_FULL_37_110]|nr:MAG: hypothetical protein A2181_04405 [Bdellovibrionales bacterium RIFOXYA1_FULL_38_20]OFZ52479.1 MAG: hypothetical protein A2417_00360 [Bdellovibrionales bacterium RIFOXYC1_FULL_37_79]OFZ59681.1 MAG: hypothetical protein A2381_07640 [Bdellovibrionales bacterium RIFOXYB1_FULL_37_110]OFZ62608.1 MAG: hypothetical protein A2577_11960 [Bdellovibrionales bacterium RIFOXYD1_FULL_36_51]
MVLNMINQVQLIFKNYYSKQLLMYGGYLFFIALFYLVLISIISFFHFMLGHKISEIQEWILGYGWQLIILSKLMAFFCIFQIIGLDAYYKDLYRYITEKKIKKFDRNILILILFTAVFFITLGQPVIIPHHQFQMIRFALALVGITAFYVADLILIVALQIVYPLDKRTLVLRLLIFPLLFLLSSKLTYTFAENINIFVWGQFFVTMYLLNIDRNNYLSVLLYITITSAVFVFCGGDPVWGNLFSIFKFEKPITGGLIFGWLAIVVMYMNFKRSKTLLKIKRKIHLWST